jgi:DNA-binding LacI/PurR family transcriptional regulator
MLHPLSRLFPPKAPPNQTGQSLQAATTHLITVHADNTFYNSSMIIIINQTSSICAKKKITIVYCTYSTIRYNINIAPKILSHLQY